MNMNNWKVNLSPGNVDPQNSLYFIKTKTIKGEGDYLTILPLTSVIRQKYYGQATSHVVINTPRRSGMNILTIWMQLCDSLSQKI